MCSRLLVLYIGNGRVGRIVATAAAKHVTPVTLELGGKCPVIVDASADIELVARRVLWGKMLNCGQTCAAPDYLIIPENIQGKLVDALKQEYKKFYPEGPLLSDSFGRICTDSHWNRIDGILKATKGDIVLGGRTVKAQRYVEPTIVQNVSFDDSLMSEEIFGPILPIIPVSIMEEGLKYINAQDTPLTLYVFSKNPESCSHIKENTRSGSFVENDVLISGATPTLPFGGIGASGYGCHKGQYSFETFTHKRSWLQSPKWVDTIGMYVRYPPYSETNTKKAGNAFIPAIPYPRPGESAGFNWARWTIFGAFVAVLGVNHQRIVGLAGNFLA